MPWILDTASDLDWRDWAKLKPSPRVGRRQLPPADDGAIAQLALGLIAGATCEKRWAGSCAQGHDFRAGGVEPGTAAYKAANIQNSILSAHLPRSAHQPPPKGQLRQLEQNGRFADMLDEVHKQNMPLHILGQSERPEQQEQPAKERTDTDWLWQHADKARGLVLGDESRQAQRGAASESLDLESGCMVLASALAQRSAHAPTTAKLGGHAASFEQRQFQRQRPELALTRAQPPRRSRPALARSSRGRPGHANVPGPWSGRPRSEAEERAAREEAVRLHAAVRRAEMQSAERLRLEREAWAIVPPREAIARAQRERHESSRRAREAAGPLPLMRTIARPESAIQVGGARPSSAGSARSLQAMCQWERAWQPLSGPPTPRAGGGTRGVGAGTAGESVRGANGPRNAQCAQQRGGADGCSSSSAVVLAEAAAPASAAPVAPVSVPAPAPAPAVGAAGGTQPPPQPQPAHRVPAVRSERWGPQAAQLQLPHAQLGAGAGVSTPAHSPARSTHARGANGQRWPGGIAPGRGAASAGAAAAAQRAAQRAPSAPPSRSPRPVSSLAISMGSQFLSVTVPPSPSGLRSPSSRGRFPSPTASSWSAAGAAWTVAAPPEPYAAAALAATTPRLATLRARRAREGSALPVHKMGGTGSESSDSEGEGYDSASWGVPLMWEGAAMPAGASASAAGLRGCGPPYWLVSDAQATEAMRADAGWDAALLVGASPGDAEAETAGYGSPQAQDPEPETEPASRGCTQANNGPGSGEAPGAGSWGMVTRGRGSAAAPDDDGGDAGVSGIAPAD